MRRLAQAIRAHECAAPGRVTDPIFFAEPAVCAAAPTSPR